MILVDSKEEAIADYLFLLGAKFKKLPLECDFVVGNYYIERKSWNDFQQSIKDGRIHKLLNKFKHDLIFIIECGNRNDRMSSKSILAMFARILSLGHSVIFLKDEKETARFLKYLDEKVINPSSLLYAPPVDKRNWGDLSIAFLCCLPGVGVKKAFKIMKKFKNLKNFLNSSKVEREKVLGKKVAEKIEKFFSHNF